ncbi:type II secretion system F family protein [Desulfobulbus alkaliphilus]|uniref:type II secretion system F family protein n=1 Tax=Desulfobulbus alkaliphilus TaxID=869814 RepID=UPI001963D88D|nr:type II secretion system F family protein [Desulfobulbus alkaliphilus]MBM9536579.1 type II secretion system F family protein [Desulfobulbus alkaliphilus]
MPIYTYTAIDNKGAMSRSTMVAADPSAVAASILAKGMTPMAISEVEEGGVDFNRLLRSIGVIRLREVVLFLRMMAALIGSGITITEAIAVLHEQTINRKFKFILGEVKMLIEGGVSFSDALSRYPRVFPEIVVNMIRAGEAGGILERVLLDLVEYLEKRAALKKLLLRSFLYPSVVLVVAIGVVVFLVTFVIPRFSELLQGSRLPWNTQLMLDLSAFLITNGKTIVMSVMATVAVTVLLFVIRETRHYIDLYKVFMPVLGLISRLGTIVQFARTLGSLLASGIPLVEALTITQPTLGNQAAKNAIDKAIEKVAAGEQLSVVLAGTGIFTSLMISLVRIGEQSGNLEKQVLLVAEIYEQQLEDRIKLMTLLIEPMLIIFLGGLVGFVAWALVAGMLTMYQS